LGWGRPHGVEKLGASNEHHACAEQGKHPAEGAGVDLHIMLAAFDSADSDCINDEIRLEPRLDGEQSGETLQHDYG
jgi:hypothetical protein